MNRSLLLLLALLGTLPVLGQMTTPRRGAFSLLGGYSLSQTLMQPRVTVLNGPYQLRGEDVKNVECYDDAGRLVDCNGQQWQLSLGVQYRLTNKSGQAGWMLFANVSHQQQVLTLNYPSNRRFSIPVNCTPSIHRHLRSTGASFSIGHFWNIQDGGSTQLFVRLGTMVAQGFSYLRGGVARSLPDPTPVSYLTLGGSGTIIEMYENVPQQNWLIIPEIGLTGHRIPAELALSFHLPVVQSTVFSELHSFVENRRITGQNRVDYSNSVINLTARLGFNLSSEFRKARAPKRRYVREEPSPDPVYPQPDPAPVKSESPVHHHEPATPETKNGRFDNVALSKPVRLLINFDRSEAELLPDSFVDLDALVQWMNTNSTAEIRLEGHTDLIGDAAENLDLSRRRVVAVKDYLSRRGVASFRVEAAWFGESKPLNRNCPPPAYCPENRRVEMVIKKR